MKQRLTLHLAAALLCAAFASTIHAQSSAFTYQGRFAENGEPFTGNGAGVTDVNAGTLQGLDASAFWRAGGNVGTTAGVNFRGTTDDQALELHVNNQRGLRIEDHGGGNDVDTLPGGAPNVIGVHR